MLITEVLEVKNEPLQLSIPFITLPPTETLNNYKIIGNTTTAKDARDAVKQKKIENFEGFVLNSLTPYPSPLPNWDKKIWTIC